MWNRYEALLLDDATELLAQQMNTELLQKLSALQIKIGLSRKAEDTATATHI